MKTNDIFGLRLLKTVRLSGERGWRERGGEDGESKEIRIMSKKNICHLVL